MIHDHVKLLESRVKFLAEFIGLIDTKTSGNKFDTIEKFDLLNKRYSLQTELNHKSFLLEQYQKDAKRQEEEQKKIIETVNKNMGIVIGKLRKVKGLDDMRTAVRKPILKRFEKQKYESMARKINDYNMANQVILWAEQQAKEKSAK